MSRRQSGRKARKFETADDEELTKTIDMVSKLVEFATYENVGLTKEVKESRSVISGEESPIPYSKSNYRNEEKRRHLTISALKKIKKPYMLFHLIEGLAPDQTESYIHTICEETKFSGIFKVVKIESEQCILTEIIGLKRKKYYILIEKVLLNYFPVDFFEVGNLYFFQNLVINYANKEKVIVFLIHQETKGKGFSLIG